MLRYRISCTLVICEVSFPVLHKGQDIVFPASQNARWVGQLSNFGKYPNIKFHANPSNVSRVANMGRWTDITQVVNV